MPTTAVVFLSLISRVRVGSTRARGWKALAVDNIRLQDGSPLSRARVVAALTHTERLECIHTAAAVLISAAFGDAGAGAAAGAYHITSHHNTTHDNTTHDMAWHDMT